MFFSLLYYLYLLKSQWLYFLMPCVTLGNISSMEFSTSPFQFFSFTDLSSSVLSFFITSLFFCWTAGCVTASYCLWNTASIVYLIKFLLKRNLRTVFLLWMLYDVPCHGYNNFNAVIMPWCPLFLPVILVCSNIRQRRPAARCGHSGSTVFPLKC